MNTWDLCSVERVLTTAASWIAAYSVHATAVVALVWLITRVLPRRHLAAAHVLWRAALIVPLLTAWLAQSDHRDFGRWRIELALPTIHAHQPAPILPAELSPTVSVVAVNHVRATAEEVSNPWPILEPIAQPVMAQVEEEQALPVLASLEPLAPSPSDSPVHVGGWWLLALAALASSLLATWVWWRHHQRSERLLVGAQRLDGGPLVALTQSLARHAGLDAVPELWLAPALSSPVALRRHRIVLPTYFIEPQHLPLVRAALAHEVAHLARRDPQWYAASHLLRALFAFAPLQWLIVRELHRSMEQLCDDWAVALLGGNVELAKSLAWVASTPSPHLLPPYLTAMTMHRTSLSQRVHYILQDQAGTLPRHVGVRTLTAALALGLVITWGTPTFAVSLADHTTEAAEPITNNKVSTATPAPATGTPTASPTVAAAAPTAKATAATKPTPVTRPVKASKPVAARPPAPPAQPLPSLASAPPAPPAAAPSAPPAAAPSAPPAAPTVEIPPVHVNVDFEMPPMPPMPPIEPLLAKLDIPNMVQTTLANTLPVVLAETSWIAKEAAALGPKAAEVARLQQALTKANGDSKRQAELQKQLDKAQAELDRAEEALEAKAEAMEARIEAQTAKIEAWAEKFEKEMEPQIEAMAAKHAEQWEAWAEKVQAQAEKAQEQAERAQEQAQDHAERAKEHAERARERAQAQVDRAKEQAQRAQERAKANRSPEKGRKIKPERVKNKP